MKRDLATEIKARRESFGWSQEELARRAGVDQTMVSRVEKGKVGKKSKVLLPICMVLGIRTDDAIPFELSPGDREHIEKLRQLPPRVRAKIEELVEEISTGADGFARILEGQPIHGEDDEAADFAEEEASG